MEDSLINGGSFNIAEIDARLSALQQYMNDLATWPKSPKKLPFL